MKKFITAAILIAFTSSASAGTLVYTPEVEPIIMEDTEPMGSGSGAWIIPLILLGLLALAASNSDSNSPTNNSNSPGNNSSNGFVR